MIPSIPSRTGPRLGDVNLILLCALLLLAGPVKCFSQEEKKKESHDLSQLPDSVSEKLHNPTKAALLSAVLPGLGQVYNKKYWKVPIVYAGFGVMTYFIVFNTNQYLDYRSAYIESVNGVKNGNYAWLVNQYNSDQLLSAEEYYRRNLEISVLLTTLWYSLNILDALVDAHLMTYNINKDLSLRFRPVVAPPMPDHSGYQGLGITLKF